MRMRCMRDVVMPHLAAFRLLLLGIALVSAEAQMTTAAEAQPTSGCPASGRAEYARGTHIGSGSDIGAASQQRHTQRKRRSNIGGGQQRNRRTASAPHEDEPSAGRHIQHSGPGGVTTKGIIARAAGPVETRKTAGRGARERRR